MSKAPAPNSPGPGQSEEYSQPAHPIPVFVKVEVTLNPELIKEVSLPIADQIAKKCHVDFKTIDGKVFVCSPKDPDNIRALQTFKNLLVEDVQNAAQFVYTNTKGKIVPGPKDLYHLFAGYRIGMTANSERIDTFKLQFPNIEYMLATLINSWNKLSPCIGELQLMISKNNRNCLLMRGNKAEQLQTLLAKNLEVVQPCICLKTSKILPNHSQLEQFFTHGHLGGRECVRIIALSKCLVFVVYPKGDEVASGEKAEVQKLLDDSLDAILADTMPLPTSEGGHDSARTQSEDVSSLAGFKGTGGNHIQKPQDNGRRPTSAGSPESEESQSNEEVESNHKIHSKDSRDKKKVKVRSKKDYAQNLNQTETIEHENKADELIPGSTDRVDDKENYPHSKTSKDNRNDFFGDSLSETHVHIEEAKVHKNPQRHVADVTSAERGRGSQHGNGKTSIGQNNYDTKMEKDESKSQSSADQAGFKDPQKSEQQEKFRDSVTLSKDMKPGFEHGVDKAEGTRYAGVPSPVLKSMAAKSTPSPYPESVYDQGKDTHREQLLEIVATKRGDDTPVYERTVPVSIEIALYLKNFCGLSERFDPAVQIKMKKIQAEDIYQMIVKSFEKDKMLTTCSELRQLVTSVKDTCSSEPLKTLPRKVMDDVISQLMTAAEASEVLLIQQSATTEGASNFSATLFGTQNDIQSFYKKIENVYRDPPPVIRTRRLAASYHGDQGSMSLPYLPSEDKRQLTGTSKSGSKQSVCCYKHVPSGVKLFTFQADITKLHVDIIVNAANDELRNNGGVAKAIEMAAGKSLREDCRAYIRSHGPLGVSDVCHTTAGNLPCAAVIHAVGPYYSVYNSDAKCADVLRDTFSKILQKAATLTASTVAIPAISSGTLGVPMDIVVSSALEAALKYLRNFRGSITSIAFVDIFPKSIEHFHNQLSQLTKSAEFEEVPDLLPSDFCGGNLLKGAGSVTQNSYKNATTHYSTALGTVAQPNQDFRSLPTFHHTSPKPMVAPTSENDAKDDEDKKCSICMETVTNPKVLSCKHTFCTDCIDQAFKYKPVCPECGMTHGVLTGNQPKGKMKHSIHNFGLPGYEYCKTIVIEYEFPDGRQENNHPKPDRPYYGTYRKAFLPDNDEGRKVLKLLEKAFEAKVLFTIGRSVTTGRDDVVTWNDVHHKTSVTGGSEQYGYPDPTYLSRVQDELATKGILPEPVGSVKALQSNNAKKRHVCQGCKKEGLTAGSVLSVVCMHTVCDSCKTDAIRTDRCPCGTKLNLYLNRPRSSSSSMSSSVDDVSCQPERGTLKDEVEKDLGKYIKGFERVGIILVTISFPTGHQKTCHSNSGHKYQAKEFKTSLPNNKQGQDLLALWKIGLRRNILFTVKGHDIAWNVINAGKSKWSSDGEKNQQYLSSAIAEMNNLLSAPGSTFPGYSMRSGSMGTPV